MIAGDRGMRVVGVEHVATRNSVTVRVRIYLRDLRGKLYSFDADVATFELDAVHVNATDAELGIFNNGVAK